MKKEKKLFDCFSTFFHFNLLFSFFQLYSMNFNQLEDYQEDEMIIKRRDYSKLSQENCKIIGSFGSDPCQFKNPIGICINNQNY